MGDVNFPGWQPERSIQVIEDNGLTRVRVRGQPYMRWRSGDEECVRLAIVRAVQFCQKELHCSKLPFGFVQVLQQWPTADPVKLKLACSMLKGGPYYVDIARLLRE